MEPISMTLMLGAGLITQGIGSIIGMEGAERSNAAKQEEIRLEQQVNEQHRVAMELDARRKSVENLRNVQRAKSMSLMAATNQGAQFGSGLQGGMAQVSGQGAWNQAGISQNLQIGRNVFDLNNLISQQRMQEAEASQTMQLGAGISSFGSSMMQASQAFGRLASGPSGPRYA